MFIVDHLKKGYALGRAFKKMERERITISLNPEQVEWLQSVLFDFCSEAEVQADEWADHLPDEPYIAPRWVVLAQQIDFIITDKKKEK